MAEVVAPGHGRHTSNVNPMAIPGGPTIEMIPNPNFSFPRQPPASPTRRRQAADNGPRPSSMQSNLPPAQSGLAAHRRAVSTLPSFTFNAGDASGLAQTPTTTPPETPGEEEAAPFTPPRRGHRRGGSEFVGGDSRFGVTNAVSSSPTKPNALPLPVPPPGPPAGRRGHSHRRSAAISSHDLSNIMHPTEPQPRLSSSLPTTPMELPGQSPPLDRATSAPDVHSDPFGPPLDEQVTRPPSRPRVGFSDNVEIIPRPLSTISSETESSMSTIRGHSVNNSISSVLSLGTPSPPSSRPSRPSLSAALEDEPKPRAKSSVEISRRVEKEGEWLKSRSSQSLKRPLSESAAEPPKTTFVEPEPPARRRTLHKKKQSLSYALGLDRRRSEPAIGMGAGEPSRNSAISLSSLSSVSDGVPAPLEPASSTKRLKAWASAKISKKPKESHRAVSETSSRSSTRRPESAGSAFVPGRVATQPTAPAAETDLDAVLGTETSKSSSERPVSPSKPRIEVSAASPTVPSPKLSYQDNDDDGTMLDLDAAMGPFNTPPMGGAQRQRKELHSSRLNRDFTGPGGHYHRRAESLPALPPFDASRVSTPSQSSMADVFEEEEEEDEEDAAAARGQRPGSTKSVSEEEVGVGISVVDSASAGVGSLWNLDAEDGLGIRRGEWEPERPTTSYSNAASRLSTSGTDRRGSSIIEETIFEEVSPIEAPAAAGVEIVDPDDEPRASSLTKSSDSSETPTLLGPASLFPASDGQHSMTTPDTCQTSTFSSPDFTRRQTSFDASRLNTAASSIADTRTTSSCTTGEQGSEVRMSVDDVPSLTSSRSTMLSTAQANHSQRNVVDDRTPSSASEQPSAVVERRTKRASIASLSQLLSSRSRDYDDLRPKTSADPSPTSTPAKKKEHRLKKLMFWKAKHGTSKGAMRSQP